MPTFIYGRYFYHGTIRCRLKGITIRQVLGRLQSSGLAFMTENETLGYYVAARDFCTTCHRYRKQVRFIVRHFKEAINVQMHSTHQGTKSISGFPKTMQCFLNQQELATNFGSAAHFPANFCTQCLEDSKHNVYSLSVKRKAEPSTPFHQRPKGRKKFIL